MAKPFFRGSKETSREMPKEPPRETTVNPEPVNSVNDELQRRIQSLQAEVEQTRIRLKDAEGKMLEMKNKLEDYQGKEMQIAEVMISAQISAQKIETSARVQAEMLLQQTDEELRRKYQELELMRMKVQLFKQEMSDRIDQYKLSLERTFDLDEEVAFTPTLVSKDNKNEQKRIG